MVLIFIDLTEQVAYGMLTMITSMLCHVVHLQGHAGGSIRSCVYYQHEELLDSSSTKGAKRHRPKVRPEFDFRVHSIKPALWKCP